MDESQFVRTLISVIAVGSGLFFFGGAVLFVFFRALDKESDANRMSYWAFAKLAALIAVILISVGVLVKLL